MKRREWESHPVVTPRTTLVLPEKTFVDKLRFWLRSGPSVGHTWYGVRFRADQSTPSVLGGISRARFRFPTAVLVIVPRARNVPVSRRPTAPKDWETETAVFPCTRSPWPRNSWTLWVAWGRRWRTTGKLCPAPGPVCRTTCRSSISRGFPRRTAPRPRPPRNIHLVTNTGTTLLLYRMISKTHEFDELYGVIFKMFFFVLRRKT